MNLLTKSQLVMRKVTSGEPSANNSNSREDEQNAVTTTRLMQIAPLIRRVALNRLGRFCRQAVEDVTQRVLMDLWRWQARRESEPELSIDEWNRLANKAAQNAVKMYFRQASTKEVLLTDLSENNDTFDLFPSHEATAGNTEVEAKSLLKFFWKEIEQLSLRRRYALLLQNHELIVYLLSNQVADVASLADALKMTREELLNAIESLPLRDEQIAELWQRKFGEKLSAKQIWEARSKTRLQLADALAKTR